MEQRLIEKFGAQFKPIDKPVKDENLLIFLDKRNGDRFDRDTFLELKSRIEDRKQEMTPLNFAKVYYHAYELLEQKNKRFTDELNNIDRMGRLVKSSRSEVQRIFLSDITLENYSDSSNFLQFEVAKDFVVNVYNFRSENFAYIFIPQDKLQNANSTVTLYTSSGKVLDVKPINLGRAREQSETIKFNDNSVLSFTAEIDASDAREYTTALTQKKTELQNFQIFTRNKRGVLIETFKDVFLKEANPLDVKKNKCSTLLIICVVLTGLMFGLSLYLNFTRCMFIDIFIATSFFGNMYIWRNFNIFLGIKLILVLVASIIMDLTWEIMKLIHYSHKYEDTLKSVRIQGFVINGVNILLKLALIFFYYKLSNENQKGGFLAINDEVSINEVNEDEYLQRLPNPEDRILNN